jgi:hypothetical protein
MPKHKCLLCGRDKFSQPTPHKCVGGFRKRKLKFVPAEGYAELQRELAALKHDKRASELCKEEVRYDQEHGINRIGNGFPDD